MLLGLLDLFRSGSLPLESIDDEEDERDIVRGGEIAN